MPNLYVTPTEIKAVAPDMFQAGTTKYDAALLRLCHELSRAADQVCHRAFFPTRATRYFQGQRSANELWVTDLISVESVSISTDGGLTYTAISASDYFLTVSGDENDPRSANCLVVNTNSAELAFWPTSQRGVKIVGVWGYADDRAAGWEASTDTVQNNPLASGGASLSVSEAHGLDLWGLTPRFQVGQLLRLESEYCEATAVTAGTTNTVAIVRARNGTTAAAHAQGVSVDIWRPAEVVKEACLIQTTRLFERGQQGFGDARATAEMGQLFWTKEWDAEALGKLMRLARTAVG